MLTSYTLLSHQYTSMHKGSSTHVDVISFDFTRFEQFLICEINVNFVTISQTLTRITFTL